MDRKRFFIVLLLSASFALVPLAYAGADEMLQAFQDNDTEGYAPIDVISIDPAIEAATPYDMIVIADAEGRQNLLDSINRMAYDTDGRDITAETKEQMKNGLIEIWEKYPVVFIRSAGSQGYPTYGGSVIHIRFADNHTGITLTDSENRLLERVQVLGNYNYLRARGQANTSTSGYPEGIPGTRRAPVPGYLAVFAIGCSGLIASQIRKDRD